MTGVKSKRGKAPQSSVDFSSDNILHLNDTLCLPASPLEEVLEFYLYTACETTAGLNLSAQTAAETEEDHHDQTENAVPVDATSIKASQSTDTMNGDNLTDCPCTPLVLAGMDVVQKSSGFFSNFDWFRCEWRPLNKKKTTHALALKGEAGLA
ncbi:hypothetical protein MMC31_004997 [Peltigera leucophlebia]|nr:hypothetical protein [Peltigera leucophlebia]